MKISKRILGIFLVFIMMLCITLNFPIKASAETVTVTTLSASRGFAFLSGVAVDNSGNIYVSDYGNSTIKKMDSSGNNIVTLGTGFAFPNGLALDNSGNIYVTDSSNGAVKKMDSNGNNIVTLARGIVTSGVAVDNSGNIYVADMGNNAIKKMDSSGNNIVTLGTGFYHPYGVAVDNSGNIYVADMGNNAIKKMDSSGNNIVTLGTGFSYPTGVAVDNSGNIYVADERNNAIKKMDSSGNNIVTLGTGFSIPLGLALDNSGNIYVADEGNHAIKKIQIDTTSASSTITPTTGNFDKYASGTNYVDVPVTMTLRGNTLSSIKNGTNTLVAGTDYVVSGSTVTINKTYLATQSVGTTNLTFKFSAGADQNLAVTVADTTPGNSTITPTTGNFDKYASGTNYVDIPVTMTLNGNSLISIKNGTVSLIENIDYTTTGSAITIKKEYLATQSVGTTNLTFKFSAGAAKNLAIIINDTTVPAETTYTLTYIAGVNGSITGITSQTINSGSSGTAVTAVPNSGYYFVNWSDGVTTATRTDNAVTNTINVSANFAASSHSSGGGSTYTPPTTTTTQTTDGPKIVASVVDPNSNNKSVETVNATVTANTDGTDVVTLKPSEAIVLKQPDGTKSSLEDYSRVGYVAPANAPVKINTDGTVEVSNLAKGNNYDIPVTYDMGNGKKITIGSMHIAVDNSGNVNMTSNLIDPYGILTDSSTGKAIVGATVTLYYADTARNKVQGVAANTVVNLPLINGFKPNNNKNPQISDSIGAYGFMVFPNTDYYIVVTKDGYDTFISPTISVGYKLVKFSAKLNPPVTGVKRVSGSSRVDTAIELAKASFTGKINNIIFATADNYPDALTGSVLAYQQNAPILLVGSSQEDQDKVLTYMKNYLNTDGNVFMLGGAGVVTENFANQIKTAGYANVIRLGGENRYETATKIAEYLNVDEGTPIVIASGEDYPDALSVSSAAAVNQYPILLVTNDAISDTVKSKIGKIKPSKVYIIGKQGAISDAVENQITQLTSLDSNSVVRIGGENRYSTSIAVANDFKLSGQSSCLTTGTNFPDALAGSIYAANYNAPIILVGNSLTDEEKAYLQNSKLTGLTIFGGEGAVNSEIQTEVAGFLSK